MGKLGRRVPPAFYTGDNGGVPPPPTIPNIDQVLAEGTSHPDGNFAISVIGGVATFIPIQGETVGSYKAFATTTIPLNYLWANGAIVLIATYPDLFAVIGNDYGGDGIVNFALPNVTDRFLKGDNGINIGTSLGSNNLTTPQLPVVNTSGTISVSQNNGNITATNGAYFANTLDSNNDNLSSFVANGSQGTVVSVAGVQLSSFGGGQPHEHPHLVGRWAICFESVGVSGASPTPSFNAVLGVNPNSNIRAMFNGIPYVTQNEIPIFLTETSTFADIQPNRLHIYIGNAPLTIDLDVETTFPLPVPIQQNFSIVNISGFIFTITSGSGSIGFALAARYSYVIGVTIADLGNGYWYVNFTNIASSPTLQEVLTSGSDSSIRAKFNGVNYATLDDITVDENIYNSDGQLSNTRNVQMDTFALNFINSSNPNPTSSFTIQVNDSDFSGDYNSNIFQLNAGDGLYFLRKNRLLAVIDNSIEFGVRDNVAFGITPDYGDFKALFGTTQNDNASTFVGFRMKYSEGLFYQDSQDKTGIKYIDFGEIDPNDSSNSANFSSLLWNSLVPKKYVDNSVITGAITEQTHTTGATVTIVDNTTILYVNPASPIASLAITMPANPINGQEVKVSFGGDILSGAVVTTLSIVGNTGQTVLAGASITNAIAGDGYIFKYQSSLNLWRLF